MFFFFMLFQHHWDSDFLFVPRLWHGDHAFSKKTMLKTLKLEYYFQESSYQELVEKSVF